MPSGPRIRSNNSFGVTTDNPLSSGATTFNSTQLSTLPVVSSAHAVIVLDPKRVAGAPEIVVVTAHTSSATVATITRGQYGTSARSHVAGTAWAHVPVDEDYIEILTSSTRPSNPYEGQFIFETDTNKLVGYGGVDWAPRDAGGQLGYAQVVAAQGTITAQVDLTGLTTVVTVGTGRRIKITGSISVYTSAAGVEVNMRIKESTTVLQEALMSLASGTRVYVLERSVTITPSAGVHTYKLSLQLTQGAGDATMNASAIQPASILVEDIGAA